jgi:cytochrome P450
LEGPPPGEPLPLQANADGEPATILLPSPLLVGKAGLATNAPTFIMRSCLMGRVLTRQQRRELPPGPRTPAAVNLAQMMQRPIESLLGWRARYGDVVTVPLPIFGTGVYISDLDGIRSMLTGDQSDLHAGEANAPLAPVLGQRSVLILDGREHLRQRRLLLPPFQGSAVQSFREVIREVADAEVSRWQIGERFAARDRMRTLTFDVIVRAVFGVTDRDRIERLRHALVAVLDMAPIFLLPEVLRRDLGPWSPWGRFRRRLAAADALLYAEIDRRRTESDLEERTDVLSLLLRARDEDDQPMTDVELRDELMTMLLAGHETTATGLAFAFDLLGHNPHVLARLRDELATGDDAYLDATVTETLRIRPIIDAAERTLTKPRTIAGWDLPAGIRVYPNITVVHHRADLYPQPGEFRPERFLEDQAESYAWLPFGGGIRRCIGAALAQAEMAEVIRTVVTRVDLQPTRTDLEPVVMRGITLVPRHGTPVEVRRTAQTRPPPLALTSGFDVEKP